MTKRSSNFRQIDVTRALKAALAAGLTVAEYEVTLDGDICVKVGEEKAVSTAPLDEWRATKCGST